MNLRELQQQFKDYLLNDNSAIEQSIVNEENINAKERLAIYKEGYYRRLIDLLAIDFPTLKTLMSDQFESVIQHYLQQYPSKHYLPTFLGQYLAPYLKANTDNLLWQEMESLEYLMIQVADKKNEVVLTLEKLSKLPPEQWASVKFILCQSLAVAEFNSNAPQIWLKQQDSMSETTKTTWLVWRKDFQIKLKQLSAEEIMILQLMQQQKDFSEICDALCQSMPEEQVAQYLMQFLAQCLEEKLL